MKVKVTKAFVQTGGEIAQPGSVVEVNDGVAKDLIRRERAVLYREPAETRRPEPLAEPEPEEPAEPAVYEGPEESDEQEDVPRPARKRSKG